LQLFRTTAKLARQRLGRFLADQLNRLIEALPCANRA
jgi:hypothetical protein